MATQSLYRRYRPRRFAELKGQEHVVRALRDAVRSGREGQAYLFSGPRGTGKTSAARILAKVLNCAAPVDGEPCCECESCLAVERGTSYDVHELDAASNNGVDAIRTLIERASLGTPGRHKVYILDEVHMLSRGAEAALLKTLEEPPPHVVFVLATTDPQRVSDTIRSRTQHLHFHLLPADTLAEHVRWVAADAGLEIDERALEVVVGQGAGSARDTLSALELMVTTGGDLTELLDLDEFVQALIDHDPGRALTAAAHAISLGHETRALTEALVRHLRDGFLALMAPDLVQLPTAQVDRIAASATELGAAALVRAIERLGSALVDMRHAPDPRVVLEVALVQLAHEAAATDVAGLLERIERLERAVASGAGTAPAAATAAPAPVDPSTGRAVLGDRARRTPTATGASGSTGSGSATASGATGARTADSGASGASATGATEPATTETAGVGSDDATSDGDDPDRGAPSDATRGGATPAGERSTSAPATSGPPEADPATVWEQSVRPALKPLVRAIYSAGSFTRHDRDEWYFAAPNPTHGGKCESHRAEVEAAIAQALGRPVRIVIDTAGGRADAPSASATGPAVTGGADTDTTGAAPASTPARGRPTAADRAGDPDTSPATDHDDTDDVDLDELTDAPPETVLSPIDRLAQAFPGAELVVEDD